MPGPFSTNQISPRIIFGAYVPFIQMIFLLIAALILGANPAAANLKVDDFTLGIEKFDIADTQTMGGNTRGPALAVMKDGTVLLGGGSRGGSIYSWSEGSPNLKLLGNVIPPKERINDSRFAVTDIAVLSQNAQRARLLVSYPRLSSSRCVEVVVFQVTYDRVKSTIDKQSLWFRSKPCVPIAAVQHAAGRMEVINSSSVYLTVGDLGFSKIGDRSARGDLGSVFKISKSKVEKISNGHRNQQGIVLATSGELITSEHGPRGGDEINIIKKGMDYGWPFVTYGEPYSQGDYVIPGATGTHQGFSEPIQVWTPSIAPTELVQLPANSCGRYSGGLVMGTLRENSLVFMELSSSKILRTQIVEVDSRIRDLELMPDGRMIASTDEGELLLFKCSKGMGG